MEAQPHPLSSRANSGFPTTQHSSTATYAAFSKESRMRSVETTKLDRKSGGSRGTCSFTQPPANADRRRGAPFKPYFARPACPDLPWSVPWSLSGTRFSGMCFPTAKCSPPKRLFKQLLSKTRVTFAWELARSGAGFCTRSHMRYGARMTMENGDPITPTSSPF
jgi:hypothetical protein